MAYSRAFLFMGLLFAMALAITSEVSARELAEAETKGVVEDGRYGGGHGGHYGGGGHGGHYGGGGGGHGGHPEDKTEGVVEDGHGGYYGGGHGGHYGGGGHGGHYGGGGHGHGGHYGGGGHGHGGHYGGGGGGHGGHPENEN